MAAGVAQPLQGVVLAQKSNTGTALTVGELRPKGGFHPAGSQLHLKTAVFQVIGQHLLGVELLKAQLRVVIDVVRHGEKRGALFLHTGK